MKEGSKTKLFYVIEGVESNPEIYETREDAVKAFLNCSDNPTLTIREVQNYFRESNGLGWNYDDRSNTFKIISRVF